MRESYSDINLLIQHHYQNGTLAKSLYRIVDTYMVEGALNHPELRSLKYTLASLSTIECTLYYRNWILAGAGALVLTDIKHYSWLPRAMLATTQFAAFTVMPYISDTVMPYIADTAMPLISDYAVPALALGAIGYSTIQWGRRLFTTPENPISKEQAKASQDALLNTVAQQFTQALSFIQSTSWSVSQCTMSIASPETSEMWQGWVSWIISLLGNNNPEDSINQSSLRVFIDSIEAKLISGKLSRTQMLSCAKKLYDKSREIHYYVDTGKVQFNAEYLRLLNIIAKHIRIFTQSLQSLFIELDKIEEKLFLKPGLLTKPLTQLVSPIYDALYQNGHSLGIGESQHGQRHYIDTPPFKRARKQNAQTRLRSSENSAFKTAYLANDRYDLPEIDRVKKALILLNGTPVEYWLMRYQEFDSDAAENVLLRVAALLNNAQESDYIYQYQHEERSIEECVENIKAYTRKLTQQDSSFNFRAPDANAQDTCHEQYYMRISNARAQYINQQTELSTLQQELKRYTTYSLRDIHSDFWHILTSTFGQKSAMANDLKQDTQTTNLRQALTLLQGEIDQVANNHTLNYRDQTRIILKLIDHYFPPECDIPSKYLDQINVFYDTFRALNNRHPAALVDKPLTLRQIQAKTQTSGAIKVYNLLRNLRKDDGLLSQKLCQHSRYIDTILNTLVAHIHKTAFISSLSENEKMLRVYSDLKIVIAKLESEHINADTYPRNILIKLSQACINQDIKDQYDHIQEVRATAEHGWQLVRNSNVKISSVSHFSSRLSKIRKANSTSTDNDESHSAGEASSASLAAEEKLEEDTSSTTVNNNLDAFMDKLHRHFKFTDKDSMDEIYQRIKSYYNNIASQRSFLSSLRIFHHEPELFEDNTDRATVFDHPLWDVLAHVAEQHRSNSKDDITKAFNYIIYDNLAIDRMLAI